MKKLTLCIREKKPRWGGRELYLTSLPLLLYPLPPPHFKNEENILLCC